MKFQSNPNGIIMKLFIFVRLNQMFYYRSKLIPRNTLSRVELELIAKHSLISLQMEKWLF